VRRTTKGALFATSQGHAEIGRAWREKEAHRQRRRYFGIRAISESSRQRTRAAPQHCYQKQHRPKRATEKGAAFLAAPLFYWGGACVGIRQPRHLE